MGSGITVWCLIVACFTVGAISKPHHARKNRLLQNPRLYHGDILLLDGQDRNAIPDDENRWPNGIIPYVLVDKTVQEEKNEIIRAMRHIEVMTDGCIQFVERTTEQDYVGIIDDDGCYSVVGRTKTGRQDLSLSEGCFERGTIVHELMHAVGFDHEQNRSDRDDYLDIFWENIMDGEEEQFRKLLPHENRLLGPFDYHSIMIYGEETFSYDGYSKTMVAKEPGVKLLDPSHKAGMTKLDILKTKKLYGCS